MENKRLLSTTLRPFGDRTIDAPMVAIDIELYADELKREKTWKEYDRNAITLYKTDGICVLLLALRMGMQMKDHISEGCTLLHILTGELILTTDSQSLRLVKGQMVALHKGVAHKIEAIADTEILITETLDIGEDILPGTI